MLFHEIYSTYFQTVAKILAEAVEHPLTTEEINAIIQDYAFEESILNIPKSLGMAHWQLLKGDGTTILRKNPTMPLTILQKRWINAIALDPRIRLFILVWQKEIIGNICKVRSSEQKNISMSYVRYWRADGSWTEVRLRLCCFRS